MVQAVLLLAVALVSVQGTRAPVPRELHENFKSRRGNKRRLDGNSRVLKESTLEISTIGLCSSAVLLQDSLSQLHE